MEVEIEQWSTEAFLYGVDMEAYPLTVQKSAGEKRAGNTLLLAVGEDFFPSLYDTEQQKISSRRQQLLIQELPRLRCSISIKEQEKDSRESPGEFLGIVKESGLYMEQEDMKRWLSENKKEAKTKGICMLIKGKSHAKKAEKILEQAGFAVESRTAKTLPAER